MDATNIERNLYLTMQLMELDTQMCIRDRWETAPVRAVKVIMNTLVPTAVLSS